MNTGLQSELNWLFMYEPSIDLWYKVNIHSLQVFIPDYNVSVAELVIPGSDLSQHIRF